MSCFTCSVLHNSASYCAVFVCCCAYNKVLNMFLSIKCMAEDKAYFAVMQEKLRPLQVWKFCKFSKVFKSLYLLNYFFFIDR